MRGRHSWGVAVRRPCGRHRPSGLPVASGRVAQPDLALPGDPRRRRALRVDESGHQGPGPVGQHQSGGTRPRPRPRRSAPRCEAAAGRRGAPRPRPLRRVRGTWTSSRPRSGGSRWRVTVVIALAMAVGLFIVVPLVVAKAARGRSGQPHPLQPGGRASSGIAIFILYLVVVSLHPRPAQGVRVSRGRAQAHPRLRGLRAARPGVRAGSSPPGIRAAARASCCWCSCWPCSCSPWWAGPSVPWLVLSRIVGIPIIVGIGYEVGIKWAGRSKRLWARIMLWPGIQLQRLTTREPSDRATGGGGGRSRGGHSHGRG